MHKKTVKLTNVGMCFLDRFRTNRRKQGTDKKDAFNWQLIEIIYQYLKNNDKVYQELLKMEYVKNA